MPESSPKSDLRRSLIRYASLILSRRPYFKFKLREKLFLRAEKLGFTQPAETIDSIVEDLAQSGYLDDLYLAEAYVRRQLAKGYGPKVIILKLKYLGLDRETSLQAVKSEVTEEAEMSSLQKYSRKFASQDRRKVISKLYSRGYNPTLIQKVFDGDWLED